MIFISSKECNSQKKGDLETVLARATITREPATRNPGTCLASSRSSLLLSCSTTWRVKSRKEDPYDTSGFLAGGHPAVRRTASHLFCALRLSGHLCAARRGPRRHHPCRPGDWPRTTQFAPVLQPG